MRLTDRIRLTILEELYWHGPLMTTGIPICQTFRKKFLLQMLIEGSLTYRDEVFWDLSVDGNALYEKLAKLWDY